jgi:hypothetical protein
MAARLRHGKPRRAPHLLHAQKVNKTRHLGFDPVQTNQPVQLVE